MRILFLGDVVGRSGRDAVCVRLPEIRQRLGLDRNFPGPWRPGRHCCAWDGPVPHW